MAMVFNINLNFNLDLESIRIDEIELIFPIVGRPQKTPPIA